ncbi:MAG TPA: hypothetical protein VHZ24_03760 [Pirellulales bacterium]|jgi:hypothetical protein|nr:hypothetical protein [Pirellulales bacterium]
MKRRRFLFWIGFGFFTLGEKLRVVAFDDLAAGIMADDPPKSPLHWRAARNENWLWYEQETYKDGRWMLTGITTPINKQTGEPYTEHKGYLDPNFVPLDERAWESEDGEQVATGKDIEHLPDPKRRARHGRPPSKWLRSLHADELHIWLETIDVPEAGVSGMTYWEHLTRDHFFDAEKLEGLSIDEQAKLHAAAHHGY